MKVRVLVEHGDKRFFATAVDWPGWSRSGRTRDEALARLVEYGERYLHSIGAAATDLHVPESVADLNVVDDVSGDMNVDFGVPHTIVELDRDPLTPQELKRQIGLLNAAWQAFEKAAARASGKELAPGPRGGGRGLDKIVDHVAEADRMYIGAVGAKAPPSGYWQKTRRVFVDALEAKVRGELPERGPRGGERWPARYAIRRSAWHALDHAWEIEDRSA
jgi:predicted RNase H-like HicB family nuclease